MGTITGLAKVQEELAKRPKSEDFEDKKPGVWVNIDDGQTVKLVFLNELDEGSPNYNADMGTALFSTQHSNPENWKKTAECTAEEGDCYGCSQGWRQKIVLYVNALVNDGKNEPYVAIWSKGVANGSVAQDLIDIAANADDYDASVTLHEFNFKRTGEKTNTTYSLQVLPKPHKVKITDYKDELFDLPRYVFHKKPSEQEEYYTDGVAPAERKPVAVGATDINQQW